jgi:hypothetical protein
VGTRRAPGAALRREVGADFFVSGAPFSELLGTTVFIQPGATWTRGASGAALRREVGHVSAPELP